MVTLQHTAITFMSEWAKTRNVMAILPEQIPWIILPDAVRAYIGPRQPSHFETLPDGTDVSWVRFPDGDVLKEMTKETASQMMEIHLASGIRSCVIGEETQIDLFDQKNFAHPYFHELRSHMLQDMLLDMALREDMVDVKGRFEDRFVVRHNTQCVLDGKQLREQVKLFEELGFLYLVGKIYQQSGALLNGEWFANVVYPALQEVYPQDLADTTFKFMKIPEYIEKRINAMDFSIRDEDRTKVLITPDLEGAYDKLYSAAMLYTCRELL